MPAFLACVPLLRSRLCVSFVLVFVRVWSLLCLLFSSLCGILVLVRGGGWSGRVGPPGWGCSFPSLVLVPGRAPWSRSVVSFGAAARGVLGLSRGPLPLPPVGLFPPAGPAGSGWLWRSWSGGAVGLGLVRRGPPPLGLPAFSRRGGALLGAGWVPFLWGGLPGGVLSAFAPARSCGRVGALGGAAVGALPSALAFSLSVGSAGAGACSSVPSGCGSVVVFSFFGSGRVARARSLRARAFLSGLSVSVVVWPGSFLAFVAPGCALGSCPALAWVPLARVRSAGPGCFSCPSAGSCPGG